MNGDSNYRCPLQIESETYFSINRAKYMHQMTRFLNLFISKGY